MKIESATWKQWVDLDLDGQLRTEEKARLDEILEAEPRALAERQALESLHRIIDDDRVPVTSGFAARVMAALPTAWWEHDRASAGLPRWALPLAMMLVLALGAGLLLGGAEETGRFTGIGLALIDFLQVTFLAGAGMLFATWRGVGWGLEHLVADSGLSLVAMAVAVLFLNLLFFSMLRRRPAAAEETTPSGDG